MKYLFLPSLFLFLFMSNSLSASTINLNVGESVTIQANSTTTVNCGGQNATCTLPVKNLKIKFDYCKANGNNSVEECLDQIWPNFKQSFNQCTSQGFEICLNFCKSSFENLDCLTSCN